MFSKVRDQSISFGLLATASLVSAQNSLFTVDSTLTTYNTAYNCVQCITGGHTWWYSKSTNLKVTVF